MDLRLVARVDLASHRTHCLVFLVVGKAGNLMADNYCIVGSNPAGAPNFYCSIKRLLRPQQALLLQHGECGLFAGTAFPHAIRDFDQVGQLGGRVVRRDVTRAMPENNCFLAHHGNSELSESLTSTRTRESPRPASQR